MEGGRQSGVVRENASMPGSQVPQATAFPSKPGSGLVFLGSLPWLWRVSFTSQESLSVPLGSFTFVSQLGASLTYPAVLESLLSRFLPLDKVKLKF